jgi:hypothetical protein
MKKVDKLDFIKILKFCATKAIIKKVKDNIQEENMCNSFI